MMIKLADPGLQAKTTTSQQRPGPDVDVDLHVARLCKRETAPSLASTEYRLLYLPTMLGVYTARHQQMPTSDESLREHVFGANSHAGCEACREETEFLVAHQKKFF